MPNKMWKQCRVPGCAGLTRERYCEKHKHLDAQRKLESAKYYDTVFRNQESKRFYESPQWRKLREIKLRCNPYCELCHANNFFAPAEIVDHKIEIRDGGVPLDIENLQCLCRACHNQKTAKERIKRNN